MRPLCYPRPVRSPLCLLAALFSSVAIVTAATPARAETSAWVSVGGGAMGWKQGADQNFGLSSALSFDVGVGTTPDASFVFGGLARIQPIIGSGTDLALLARGATHGFQLGSWGVAVDAGAYFRTWGTASQGFNGGITLGFPLGFQLSLQTMIGTDDVLAFGAVAGIDLLRLTVYRSSLLDYWPNPSPAYTRSARRPLFSF